LKEKGVLAAAITKNVVRLVTHRGIERRHVNIALSAIKSVTETLRRRQ
jgi:threonine aldolase